MQKHVLNTQSSSNIHFQLACKHTCYTHNLVTLIIYQHFIEKTFNTLANNAAII